MGRDKNDQDYVTLVTKFKMTRHLFKFSNFKAEEEANQKTSKEANKTDNLNLTKKSKKEDGQGCIIC